MVLATARANKPRDGWSTSLRNADDDDSDDDGSSSPSAASRPPPAEGSDWDWNWSSELIDIGLVDEPAHLRFVETPFTLAKRNALTKRAAAETETLANTEKRKKLATTPAAAASAKKAKPATTTTTPAPPHQSAALKKTQGSSPPPSDGQQQAVPPISSQPSLPKDPLRATPIAQQQSREETPSSKARLISSSRFRPASMSTSSPTVFSSSSSSQSPSSSSATDKAALAIAATAETETESGQASPAAGLSSTKSTARVEHPLGTTAASLTPPSNRLPQAAPSTYSVGTGVVHKMPPNQAKISTLPCSASSSELACASPTTATKEDANDHDADDSPCLPPPPPSRRHRGDEQEGCSAAIAGTFAAPVNVNKRLPTAKLNKSDARPLKLQQQQSFPEHEGEEDDATRSLAVASAVHPRPQQQQQKRSRVGDRDLLFPQAIKAPPSSSSFSTATAGPASSSGRAPSSSSTTTTTTTMTESNSLRTTRGYREGISPETRKRLDRFKRVGNFSCSSSSTLASASSSTAAEVGTDSGRLLTLSRRGDDDGPCLDPTTTPMPDRSALESGEPVNNNNVDPGPGSSIRKVSTSTTKFSLPGFGTGSGGVVGSSLQTKKKRSRLDFTPDEPLEVFRQKKKKKKKKNAHGPLLSSSSSPFPHDNDGAWNGVEPVSPSPLHPTGAPFQQRQQRPQPKRETIVLGAAVRSVRPVSLAGTTGNTLNTLNNNNKVGTSSSSLLPKRQTGGFKRPLAAARTRGNLIIRDDDNDDDDEEERASHEGEDAKRRRLYRSLGL
ncbi:hypothetical protein B0A53_03843 [Rhodotorula sp. CCFEE 5036]|nr:hypothetical protein B0A53_03843 [Rhodotorula sp. CCFEE 5036]